MFNSSFDAWFYMSKPILNKAFPHKLVTACTRILLTSLISYASWMLVNIMDESSPFFQRCDRNSGHRFGCQLLVWNYEREYNHIPLCGCGCQCGFYQTLACKEYQTCRWDSSHGMQSVVWSLMFWCTLFVSFRLQCSGSREFEPYFLVWYVYRQIQGHMESMGLPIISCGEDMLVFRRCLAASFFLNAARRQLDGTYRWDHKINWAEALKPFTGQELCIQ